MAYWGLNLIFCFCTVSLLNHMLAMAQMVAMRRGCHGDMVAM